MTACEDPQEIGSEVFAQDIGVLYTDTLTVDASTVLLDSIVTSNGNNLLVGRTTDPNLGQIDASSYFHITPLDTLYSNVDTAGRKNVKWIRFPSKVDSVRFILPYNFYQGDTNQRQSFKVYQFADGASLDNRDKVFYYNTTTAPNLNVNPLGQIQNVKIRPIKNKNILSGSASSGSTKFDTLRIPITDLTFINFLRSQRDPTKKDNALIGTEFRRFTKGFALTSESSKNAALLGFESFGSLMKVYYNYKYTYTLRNKANTLDSITVTVDTTKANDLRVTAYSQAGLSLNARFNKITTSRTGNLAKLVKASDALPAKQANGEVYIQNASGLAIKVQFPTLAKLKARQDIAINKAELVLAPNANPSNFDLPPDLTIAESTKDNRYLRTTADGTGSIFFLTRGESYLAPYLSRTNDYTFNITSPLQNLLSGRIVSSGWIIAPTAIITSAQGRSLVSGSKLVSYDVNRAVFNTKNIKLKVYYTYVAK